MKKTITIIIFILIFPFSLLAGEGAVVSAHPLATKVGISVLRQGGNAIDAAIATAFALSVVEPYHSGLGGGGLMVYYQAKTKEWFFVNYREVAPIKIKRSLYMSNPEAKDDGIHSIGVPGFLKGMESIHQKWASKQWEDLIEPSRLLAEKGFPLKGQLVKKIKKYEQKLSAEPEIKQLILDPYQRDDKILIQSDLAKTLKEISQSGAALLYGGPLGQQIVHALSKKGLPITLNDLKKYQVKYIRPHRFTVGRYEVISSASPSSGGKGLEFLFNHMDANKSKDGYELDLITGFKKYFEYRDRYLGDFLGHTTHLNVVDDEGNMVSMTNTINDNFGSKIIVPGTGIILNNEMGDFNLDPQSKNFICPGCYPLSSMTPTIVLKDEKPFLLIGSPGGKSIPQNIFQILYGVFVRNMPLATAVKSPKIYWVPGVNKVMVETKSSTSVKKRLAKKYPLINEESIGNVQAIRLGRERKTISDKRGEGFGSWQ